MYGVVVSTQTTPAAEAGAPLTLSIPKTPASFQGALFQAALYSARSFNCFSLALFESR